MTSRDILFIIVTIVIFSGLIYIWVASWLVRRNAEKQVSRKAAPLVAGIYARNLKKWTRPCEKCGSPIVLYQSSCGTECQEEIEKYERDVDDPPGCHPRPRTLRNSYEFLGRWCPKHRVLDIISRTTRKQIEGSEPDFKGELEADLKYINPLIKDYMIMDPNDKSNILYIEFVEEARGIVLDQNPSLRSFSIDEKVASISKLYYFLLLLGIIMMIMVCRSLLL